jgi:hypothetical protein
VSEFKHIVAGKDLPFLFRLHERSPRAPTPLNRTQFTITSRDPSLTKESVLQQITSIDLSSYLHHGRNDPTAEVRDSTHAFTLEKVVTSNGVTTHILTAPTIPAASAVNFIFYLASRKNVNAARSFQISQTFTDTHTLTPTPSPPPPYQHNPPLSNNQSAAVAGNPVSPVPNAVPHSVWNGQPHPFAAPMAPNNRSGAQGMPLQYTQPPPQMNAAPVMMLAQQQQLQQQPHPQMQHHLQMQMQMQQQQHQHQHQQLQEVHPLQLQQQQQQMQEQQQQMQQQLAEVMAMLTHITQAMTPATHLPQHASPSSSRGGRGGYSGRGGPSFAPAVGAGGSGFRRF